ncbi:hypothetical protein [Microbacterium lacticum]
MSKKKVSDNERVRQLATLPAVQALKTEVEARAFARADRPRVASLKRLSEFEKVATWERVLDSMTQARALPCFSEGGHYRPGRARKDLCLVAVRVWGFR